VILLPAIDIIGGECVRLVRGEYSTSRKVAADAAETARSFQEAGAEWLHVVDLDAAKEGKPVNAGLIRRIRESCGLKLEVGGGIRDMAAVDAWLQSGVSRVILGTAAVRSPELVVRAVGKYGDRIAVGIDARGGMVAQKGWTETSAIGYVGMAEHMERAGVKTLIFTDISRDGTLSGPNLEMLGRLGRAVSCDIVASGGVGSLKDIGDLQKLGLYGAICGKALYTGALDLKEAVALCGKKEEKNG
jgi:phosphoribosylformimino-5-aminoimidazole carboxamide ribotide isomerase